MYFIKSIQYIHEKRPTKSCWHQFTRKTQLVHNHISHWNSFGHLSVLTLVFIVYQICPAQAITIEAEEREDGSRRTTRWWVLLGDLYLTHSLTSSLTSWFNFTGTTLTWPSAFTVDSAKRHALLMPLWKVPTLNSLQKLTRSVSIPLAAR